MEYYNAILVDYLGRILLAAIIWFVGKKVIRLILDLTERRLNKIHVDESLHSFLAPLIRMGLKIVLILTVAATVGIEITTFAAVIGAVSFAIGLAFQGSLSNFAGGILILVLKPFKVGDFIEASGFSGTVREIQVFYTILQTPDNQKVIIPNTDLSNSSAINYSAYDTRRANVKLTISFESDVQAAKDAIRKVAENNPLVLETPAPAVFVTGFGEHGLNLSARVWAKRTEYWPMYFSFVEQVNEAFDQAGVEVPYHQLDVRVKKED